MDLPFQFLMAGHPIPGLFYDYVSEAPIEKCLMCGDHVLESGEIYMIEKAIKGTDVLYEVAACLNCSTTSQQKISEDSMAALQDFFSGQVDLATRTRELQERYQGFDVDGWLETCVVTGKKRSELHEYTIYGLFRKDQILVGELPYMMSGEALAMISSLLSQETKDELGRIGDDNLGIPPEFEDLFRKRTPVLF